MNINVRRKVTENTKPEDIVKMLLKDRDIKDIDSFLNPKKPKDIHLADFFKDSKNFAKDWKETTKLLKKIHKAGDMVVIYMDYDADGITGGATLWQTMNELGFKVMPHIPDRKSEGYGFSLVGIDLVKEKYNPKLIISVDHGIVAHDQITYAKQQGIDVVITDHHQKKETDPEDAFAIFHTASVSGSGVAYFFAKALMDEFADDAAKKMLQKKFDSDFLALAAIGNIADLVPLTGATRSLAKYGLDAFKNVEAVGLIAMMNEAKINPEKIASYHIGFVLGPRINAFGRISHGMDALRLLCTNSKSRAKQLAAEADITNKERQDLVEQAVEEAIQGVDKRKKVLIYFSESMEEGITGLVAGKLTQIFNRPAIAMTKNDGTMKASARSIPAIDIIEFLRSKELENYFIDLGGHPGAAGFSIDTENLEPFAKALWEKAEGEITEDMLQKVITLDAELPVSLINLDLAKALHKMEPFGMGNETPLFGFKGLLKDIQFMGKNNTHARLLFQDINLSQKEFVEVVYFNFDEEIKDYVGKELSVICKININEWNGKEKVNVILSKYLPQQSQKI